MYIIFNYSNKKVKVEDKNIYSSFYLNLNLSLNLNN